MYYVFRLILGRQRCKKTTTKVSKTRYGRILSASSKLATVSNVKINVVLIVLIDTFFQRILYL